MFDFFCINYKLSHIILFFLSFITFVICKYLNEPNISTRNFNFPLNKKVC